MFCGRFFRPVNISSIMFCRRLIFIFLPVYNFSIMFLPTIYLFIFDLQLTFGQLDLQIFFVVIGYGVQKFVHLIYYSFFAQINGNNIYFSFLLLWSFFLPPVIWSYRSTDLHQIWHECVFPCMVSDALQKFWKSQKTRSRRAKKLRKIGQISL